MTALFLLLLPLSAFWQVGEPAVSGVFPLYVSRGFYLSDLPLAAMLLLSVLRPAIPRRGPGLFFYPLLALIALAFLTAFLALEPLFTLYVAIRWLLALFVYLWFVWEETRLKPAVQVLIAGLCVQALVGLVQVVLQRPLGLPGELALPPHVPGAAIVPVGDTRWLRAYGLTFHPNVLGGYMAVGLVVALPLLGRWPGRLAWWLLWAGLFVSFSRAAWVAVALVVPLLLTWLLWKRPAGRRAYIGSAAGAGLVLLACALLWWPQLQTRLQPVLARVAPAGSVTLAPAAPLEGFSLDERADLTRIGIELMREEPLTGVGAGNFPVAMVVRDAQARPQYVHMVPLLLAAEVGVGGAVLWLILWGGGIWLLGRALLGGDDVWTVALLAAWAAVGALGWLDSYPWALNTGRLLTVTMLGLAGHALLRQRQRSEAA